MIKNQSAVVFFFDRIVLRYPKTVILVLLVVVGFLGLQARHFRLDASAETLVLENDESLRYARIISSRYGQRSFLVLTYTPTDDLFSQKTLDTLSKLRNDLLAMEDVESVLSILNVPLLQSPPVSIKDLTGDLPDLESPKVDKQMASVELARSPIYKNLLISSDLKTTAMLVYLAEDEVYENLLSKRNELLLKKDSASLTQQENTELKSLIEQCRRYKDRYRQRRHNNILAIRGIMDEYRSDAELFLGGVGMIADDMITFIKKDLKIFGLGVLFFLILMLFIIFRRKRWILLPILCCLVSVVCMVGLLGWFGWEVTVISSNFISLQLIITLAIVIHLIVRFRELLVQNPEAPTEKLLSDTVRLKIIPCLYAVLTTIAGFASLVLCDILPVITFGWMMIAGLIVSLVVTFLLFPSVLMLMSGEKPPKKLNLRISLTSILANFTQRRGTLIVIISGLLIGCSIVGISKLTVENSFIDYFHKTTEIYRGMKVIDQKLGGTTPLDIVIDFRQTETEPVPEKAVAAKTDDEFDEFDEFEKAASDEKYWFNAAKMDRVKTVHNYLENLPQTGKVLSLATLLAVTEKLNNGEPLDSFELALLYSETPDEFKTMLIAPYVSVEHNEVRFWVRVKDSEKTLKRDALLKTIKKDLTELLEINPENIHLSGMLVLYNNMLQSLFDSQILTLGITVLLLMGMFLILFRSVKVALIAMFPNILSVAFVLGFMGWMNIPLDMMTITIAAISIGIAVDNTIHYIHRFKAEFEKDRNYLDTMHRCHGSIGHAMYYTSITIIIGFSILAMSNFIPSVYFGLLTGLAMLAALLGALTLLPQMLILVKPFGKDLRDTNRLL
ncbi:MAG: MMPL family transporter [Sedimentisphaerales bacterium]|nr:MMPL family transporter [Sedimentisphaerales bacterium]